MRKFDAMKKREGEKANHVSAFRHNSATVCRQAALGLSEGKKKKATGEEGAGHGLARTGTVVSCDRDRCNKYTVTQKDTMA